MNTVSSDESPLVERLDAAERRIRELEKELEQERGRSWQAQLRLAAKQREVTDIHRSRAWNLVRIFRSLKYRTVDPLLGLFGVAWPRRSAASSEIAHTPGPRAAHAGVHDVVCLSTCDWDDRFQRPQQLMGRFAEAGHRVFYVSQRFRENGPLWAIAEKRDGLYEVTLRGPQLNVYAQGLGEHDCRQLFDALDALCGDVSIGAAAMFVQLPFWWPLARAMRDRFSWPLLYDCMDFHSGFSTVRKAMVAQEEELVREADVVIVTSGVLEQRALRTRRDVLVLRNACDFEHFARAKRSAQNIRPVIGYFGAIADWFDSALVADLAARRPDWDFLLIGSTYNADLSRLAHLPNVSLPGEESYESLPEWLARFDVAIIPFKRTPLTEATNPVKVYEMLAAATPVVAVPIPEVAALAPLVRLASTAEDFEREIVAALAHDGESADARREFARGETWRHRYETLHAATAAALRARS